MKFKILINYLIVLNNQNYILAKIFIYNPEKYKVQKPPCNKSKTFFKKNRKKSRESIAKSKFIQKALKSLGWSTKIYSCVVSSLNVKDTAEHDAISVLDGFKKLLINFI